MVNNRQIVSQYQGSPPSDFGVNRKIPEGPLYAIEAVLELLELGDVSKLVACTRKCKTNLQSLGFDLEDVLDLLQDCIKNNRYRYLNSEWCELSSNGLIAACDAYVLTRSEWNHNVRKNYDVRYFVKFSIGVSGTILLLISCHAPDF